MTNTLSHQEIQALQKRPKVPPAKALQKVLTEQRSGRITIGDPQDPSISWRVYFGAGQIHFAESGMGQQERLSYLFKHYFPSLKLSEAPQSLSDYELVCHHWQSDRLPLEFVRKLLETITQEALCQFLAIAQAPLHFEPNVGLDPLLLSVPFRQLILPVRDVINRWAQLRSHISSPFQRPFVSNRDKFIELLWQATEKLQQLQSLSGSLGDDLCLYELAHTQSIEVQDLAAILQPLISAGAVGINPYQAEQKSTRPMIACVDDSQTIQQFVKFTLESSGYDSLQLMDPTKALNQILDSDPVLVLMDIEMPNIDGYELCKMLRQVEVLRELPVVMLTGREGIIDRVRARMSGCTAYLTKPFNPDELLSLVQKLTQTTPVPQT